MLANFKCILAIIDTNDMPISVLIQIFISVHLYLQMVCANAVNSQGYILGPVGPLKGINKIACMRCQTTCNGMSSLDLHCGLCNNTAIVSLTCLWFPPAFTYHPTCSPTTMDTICNLKICLKIWGDSGT